MNYTETEDRAAKDAGVIVLYLDATEARLTLRALDEAEGLAAARARLDKLIRGQGE
ncbi:hypothetical protein [Streptomyces sp. NPDC051310]|uniref:hypothetical protein n=1 Tax=Streptomyces sp. NPDC051310 TaxID=3365649 RepID=UPI0037A31F9D